MQKAKYLPVRADIPSDPTADSPVFFDAYSASGVSLTEEPELRYAQAPAHERPRLAALVLQKYAKHVRKLVCKRLRGQLTPIREDVCQDAAVILLERLETFDASRGHFWSYVRQAVYDAARKAAQAGAEVEFREDDAPQSCRGEAAAIYAERAEALPTAIDTLPPAERAVVLGELSGFSAGEMADILGASQGAIRERKRSAIRHLRAAYAGRV